MSLWLPNKTRLICTMVEFKDLSGLKQFRVFFDSRWHMLLSFIRNGWHTDFQKNANAKISSEIVFIDPDVLLSNPDGPTHLASGWNHTDKRVENCWLMGEIQVYDSEFNKMTTWGFSILTQAVVVKVHRSSTWVKVQIRILKYYSSKSKSTAFSILLEWKYKSTPFFMYLSKKYW